ncbi:MAG TPA: MJ0042-type zinc finger domain-containing protein [Gemmataceae bacterium]|nr:MJ0042-type zinc finger domain-containing protein [Gemmataceae bacterium]
MPITLNCPKCHKPFRVRDESIGGRVRCPSCGAVLQVPASLSPGSHAGLEDPRRPDEPPGEITGGHRPVAEDVPARRPPGSMDELMLGGAGRREDDLVSAGHTAGTALPAPPSIKGGRQPPPAPTPSSVGGVATERVRPKPPPATSTRRTDVPRSIRPASPADVASSWQKVRGGLGMIKWGLYLCAVPLLGAFGHGVWIMFDTDNALKEGPGLLKQADWPMWKEVMVAYGIAPLVLAVPLLLFGRLRCAAAPSDAHASGLALGAAFFTLLAIIAAVLCVGIRYFDFLAKLQIPPNIAPHIGPISEILILPCFLVAEILTLLFMGQIGFPLFRPQMQRSVAGFFFYLIMAPAAVLIAHRFYPVWDPAWNAIRQHGNPFVGQDEETSQRVLIWSVIVLVLAVMVFLRYAGVAQAGRRAIRKFLAGEA